MTDSVETEKQESTVDEASPGLSALLSARDEFIKTFMTEADKMIKIFMAEVDDQVEKGELHSNNIKLSRALAPAIRLACKESAMEGFDAGIKYAEKIKLI